VRGNHDQIIGEKEEKIHTKHHLSMALQWGKKTKTPCLITKPLLGGRTPRLNHHQSPPRMTHHNRGGGGKRKKGNEVRAHTPNPPHTPHPHAPCTKHYLHPRKRGAPSHQPFAAKLENGVVEPKKTPHPYYSERPGSSLQIIQLRKTSPHESASTQVRPDIKMDGGKKNPSVTKTPRNAPRQPPTRPN